MRVLDAFSTRISIPDFILKSFGDLESNVDLAQLAFMIIPTIRMRPMTFRDIFLILSMLYDLTQVI